jgi:hypothetical protein
MLGGTIINPLCYSVEINFASLLYDFSNEVLLGGATGWVEEG